MTTHDPAAIARGLSEAERRLLIQLDPKEENDIRRLPYHTHFATYICLIRKQIFVQSLFAFSFTPLGVAVREEILREKGMV